jgi:VWFA-related protein
MLPRRHRTAPTTESHLAARPGRPRRAPLPALPMLPALPLLLALAALTAGVPVLAQAAPASPAAPPAAAAAPPSSPEHFGEVLEVREVLLDALVTDAKGHVIVGLDKPDFVVSENGHPVELTGVTFYSNRRLIEGSDGLTKKGLRLDQVPEDRYFVLLFQDQKLNAVDMPALLSQQVLAGRFAKQWVEREVLANDWVAVASYDVKLKIHQDFTHDRALLAAAIDGAVTGKDVENNWPSRIPKPAPGAEAAPSLLRNLPHGELLREQTPTIYEGLQALARAAGTIPARKNLVLFTNGFGHINPFGQYVPDPRYYKPTMETLNSNNVAVYSVDEVPPGEHHVMANAMNLLSTETGGRYLYDFNNFLTALKEISTENNGYYLLSYRSEHPAGTTGFQQVDVKTTNPDLRLKVRKGYAWAPPTAAQP